MPNATNIPAPRSRHAPAAIDWVYAPFSFEQHLVVPGTPEEIDHALLTLAGRMTTLLMEPDRG